MMPSTASSSTTTRRIPRKDRRRTFVLKDEDDHHNDALRCPPAQLDTSSSVHPLLRDENLGLLQMVIASEDEKTSQQVADGRCCKSKEGSLLKDTSQVDTLKSQSSKTPSSSRRDGCASDDNDKHNFNKSNRKVSSAVMQEHKKSYDRLASDKNFGRDKGVGDLDLVSIAAWRSQQYDESEAAVEKREDEQQGGEEMRYSSTGQPLFYSNSSSSREKQKRQTSAAALRPGATDFT